MEALGAASSIISVLELTGKVCEYIGKVREAPEDARELTKELNSLSKVLNSLKDFVGKNPQSAILQALNAPGGPLLDCLSKLDGLERKFQPKIPWVRGGCS